MRNKISAAMIIAASLGFSTMALAADGTIKFTGNITTDGCKVTSTNGTQTVILGDVAKSAFNGVGSTAAATKFTIELASCPGTTAALRFDGTPSTDNNEIFALDNETGVATGVGVALYEKDNTTRIPVATNSAIITLADGTTSDAVINKLDYYAKYQATQAAVTAGTANSTVTFTVVYQ